MSHMSIHYGLITANNTINTINTVGTSLRNLKKRDVLNVVPPKKSLRNTNK